MESEFLEVVFINFDKGIMHGRILDGRDEYGCNLERTIEQVLTDEQREAYYDLDLRQCRERRELLRKFVSIAKER